MCWCVTGAVGSICAANIGEKRGGVTVGYYVGSTLGICASLGSVTGSKQLGGGFRFVLGGAGGVGCKDLTGYAVIVSVALARIVLSHFSSLSSEDCRCWGFVLECEGQVFYVHDDCILLCDSCIRKIFVLVKTSSRNSGCA